MSGHSFAGEQPADGAESRMLENTGLQRFRRAATLPGTTKHSLLHRVTYVPPAPETA
jgi:hypothetical protein